MTNQSVYTTALPLLQDKENVEDTTNRCEGDFVSVTPLVVSLSFFTRAHVDMTSGGQFLRRLEWFLNQYDAGKVVMASTGKGEGPAEEDTSLKCPLGAWIAAPPTVSTYSQRIISGKNAARIDRDSQQSGGEGEV